MHLTRIFALISAAACFDLRLKSAPSNHANAVLKTNSDLLPFHVEDAPLLFDHYANVFIGTPPQPFRLALYLNYFTVVVLDSQCSGDCPLRLFNQSASSTFHLKSIDQSFEDTYVMGSDQMTIAPRITAKDVNFYVVKPEFFIRDAAEDGWLSLGPSSEIEGFSLVWKLAAQNVIPKASFAIYLNNTTSSKSLISFGETHEDLYAVEAFTPVKCLKTSLYEWSINATVSFGKMPREHYQVVFVSNLMSISLPERLYSYIKNQVCTRDRKCEVKDNDLVKFSCKPNQHFPELIIGVEGKEFPISDDFYVQRKGDICWLLVTNSTQEVVNLGQPFFYAYYLNFDMETNFVEIAKSVNGKHSEPSSSWFLYVIIGLIAVTVLIAVVLLLRCKTQSRQVEDDTLREQLDVKL